MAYLPWVGWRGGHAHGVHVLVPVASVDLQRSQEVGTSDRGKGELCLFLPAPATLEWVLFFLFSPSLGLAQCVLKVCQAPGMSGLSLDFMEYLQLGDPLGIIESHSLLLTGPPKTQSHGWECSPAPLEL